MEKNVLISLCMPTSGVIEWVFPVLDSIFGQGVDDNLFEVVVTDNGDNEKFKMMMKQYVQKHSNIVYAETNALPFLNEIESYKRANGEFIKFVNHRTLLVDGALQKLVDFVKTNRKEKPIVYFANGALKIQKEVHYYNSFDKFVRNLSYWSSWSTGMAIWKEDFLKLPEDVEDFNELFPHTTVLFRERNRCRYIIDNTVIMDEMPQGKKPKGNYNLYWAFGIEYPGIIFDLFRDESISKTTFRYVLDTNLDFIAGMYFEYHIRKHYCSYDLNGLKDIFGVFYSKSKFWMKVIQITVKRLAKKLLNFNIPKGKICRDNKVER